MEDLIVCTLQYDILWENPKGNYAKIEELLSKINEPVDLIVLPEMFTTGFSMDAARVAEKHDENKMATLLWMRQMANKYQAIITGSVATEDNGKFYNRLYWVTPSGKYSMYNKKNLFAYAGENKKYTAGKNKLLEEIKGWKILPLICFDLRFPLWSKNQLKNKQPQYDLLLYVANWPQKRRLHWQKLLLARAIENQAYLVGVNRVGKDNNNIQYIGDSAVIDFMGDYLSSHDEYSESIIITQLKKSSLNAYRKVFPVLI